MTLVESPTAVVTLGQLLTETRSQANRRLGERLAFPFRLRVMNAGSDAAVRGGGFVRGRDIGPAGLGLTHADPLPQRLLVLVGADDGLTPFGLDGLRIEVVLRWRRFLGSAGYESGGRIVRSNLSLAG